MVVRLFAHESKENLAIEYVKSHARKVKDVMTRSVITAKPATPLRYIATLLEKTRIKRVPIVTNGKVVEIVESRKSYSSSGEFAQRK